MRREERWADKGGAALDFLLRRRIDKQRDVEAGDGSVLCSLDRGKSGGTVLFARS